MLKFESWTKSDLKKDAKLNRNFDPYLQSFIIQNHYSRHNFLFICERLQVGSIYKKYPMELNGMLEYVAHQLRNSKRFLTFAKIVFSYFANSVSIFYWFVK